jgi:hypothetical protein
LIVFFSSFLRIKGLVLAVAFMALFPTTLLANSSETVFLPATSLFPILTADPREARISISRRLGKNEWEGSLGRVFEVVRWRRGETLAAWGVSGAAFAWLDQHGSSFPMRANDWWIGTYLARSSGRLSHRIEYTHVSTHLGDALFGVRERIVYSREMVRLLVSVSDARRGRFYLGFASWVKTIPKEKSGFVQAGLERSFVLGKSASLVISYDLKAKQEARGAFNHSLRLDGRLRPAGVDSTGVRLGLGWTSGLSEYGQFYRERERVWTVGLYFD